MEPGPEFVTSVRRRPRLVSRILATGTGKAGAAIVLVVLFAAVFGGLVAPHSPTDSEIVDRHQGPGLSHPLGTDFLGRDQLSRVLYGARPSIFSAGGVVVVTVAIALLVGLAAGYFGGLVDVVLMRIVEVVLAFPSLILALAVAGFLGPGLRNAFIALIAVWWAGFARIIRGQVMALRNQPYVEAAESLGASRWAVIVRHILPNITSPVTVLATLDIGHVVLAFAGLSFLNLGIQPPDAEWGRMVFDAKPYIERAPLEIAVPGFAIAITVLGFNLLGDAIRDALDPTTSRGRGASNRAGRR